MNSEDSVRPSENADQSLAGVEVKTHHNQVANVPNGKPPATSLPPQVFRHKSSATSLPPQVFRHKSSATSLPPQVFRHNYHSL
jgi:hypothetical protein